MFRARLYHKSSTITHPPVVIRIPPRPRIYIVHEKIPKDFLKGPFYVPKADGTVEIRTL
jgi:hypothetical protein